MLKKIGADNCVISGSLRNEQNRFSLLLKTELE